MKYRSAMFLLLISQVAFLKGSPAIQKPRVTPMSSTTGATTSSPSSKPLLEITTTSKVSTWLNTISSTAGITPEPTPTRTGTTSGTSSNTFTSSTTTTSTTATTTESRPDYLMPHRVPSQLEEKLQALCCDLPMLPSESRLWKGNETHELLLPITIPSDCPENESSTQTSSTAPTKTCSPATLSWEGAIEIQSGDVLLVRIDDSQLVQQETIINHTDNRDRTVERIMHEPPTAVYQVTRTGHDHCDVMEGILLDITPLKVDNRKVVTLYDKDLTEGINLLIVVSELWGNQCVRLKVTVKSDNCGENEDCSGKGICYSNISMEGYECQCCSGFVGPHCEEQDACYPSPCKNNGICVDISQGHEGSTFQCLCPYGYTGKTCEETTDPCTSMPCQNGATCFGNVTHFFCQCLRGFLGPLCQHNENECESSPCVHGICVDQEDSYKCFCQPGFTGSLCEYEYNECESSPCINGGTCTDRINSYSCACTRGYAGRRCEIKVDLCEPNPCPDHRYCVDQGNNYTCECPKGYSGPDCATPVRAACSTNPCTNGGTCWSSMDSFYCACRPGYTGKTCEVETITNTDSISKDNELDLQMPISIHLDHLHNVYIAAGTLACAFVIVALIVTVCHCRVNKTYKRFMLRAYPLWICKGRRAPEPPTATNSEWFSGKDKAPTATPSRSLPSLDTTDMYYTLDFSDSQSSPLIQ